jgi:hypothetical protein
VAKANTFDEATRLGHALGRSIARAIGLAEYADDVGLGCASGLIDLPPRALPSVGEAQEQLDQSATRLDMFRRSGAERGQVRTAECDWFGAEEALTLARAAATGRLDDTIASVMPAEIMVMHIGRWSFVGWPGEVSVEYALEVKTRQPDCFVISLANGELQGYLVTAKAVREAKYEALNALFDGPESGKLLVEKTLELLDRGPAL